MMEKIFPEYHLDTISKGVKGCELLIQSSIYIYDESPLYVDIYLYPLSNHYIIPYRYYKDFIPGCLSNHLKECSTLSKYMLITEEILNESKFIIRLYKNDPEFNQKFFRYYI